MDAAGETLNLLRDPKTLEDCGFTLADASIDPMGPGIDTAMTLAQDDGATLVAKLVPMATPTCTPAHFLCPAHPPTGEFAPMHPRVSHLRFGHTV